MKKYFFALIFVVVLVGFAVYNRYQLVDDSLGTKAFDRWTGETIDTTSRKVFSKKWEEINSAKNDVAEAQRRIDIEAQELKSLRSELDMKENSLNASILEVNKVLTNNVPDAYKRERKVLYIYLKSDGYLPLDVEKEAFKNMKFFASLIACDQNLNSFDVNGTTMSRLGVVEACLDWSYERRRKLKEALEKAIFDREKDALKSRLESDF